MRHKLFYVLGFVSFSANAQTKGSPDSTFGRIDGDLALEVGLGAAIAPRGVRAAADLRFLYLQSGGVFVTYEDAFGGTAAPLRVLSFGGEIRPLFLGRWLQGLHTSAPYFDLFADSLSLSIGAFLEQPQSAGDFGSKVGLEVGIGLGFPILPRASGPWIGVRGGVRWSEQELAGSSSGTADDRSAFLAITLRWHQIFGVGTVGSRRIE